MSTQPPTAVHGRGGRTRIGAVSSRWRGRHLRCALSGRLLAPASTGGIYARTACERVASRVLSCAATGVACARAVRVRGRASEFSKSVFVVLSV